MTRRRIFQYFNAAFMSLVGLVLVCLGFWVLGEPEISSASRVSLVVVFLATLVMVCKFLPIELDHSRRREPEKNGSSLVVLGIAAGPVVGAIIAGRASDVGLYWVILLFFTVGAFLVGMGSKIAYVNSRPDVAVEE